MYRLVDRTSCGLTATSPPTLAIRTYREIAKILVERGDMEMSPGRAAQICRVAKMKIARAVSNDPMMGRYSSRGSARGAASMPDEP
jgi:hypothetical protein